MKYSNVVGIAAALLLVCCCFAPWVYITSINTTITGFFQGSTNYGKPGYIESVLCAVAIVLFMIPASWAKKTNVFIGTCLFAWSVRNFLFLSQCEMGECPERRWGLYAIVFFSLVTFIMSLLPRLAVNQPNTTV